MEALKPRGRELTLAGDCFGCHSLAKGPMGAGGLPIDTPMGTIYSSNITPDPTYGIGRYSRADFHRAVREGINASDRNLYPAMPYVYTQITTPEDVDAIYSYIMSIPPVAKEVPANTGVFQFPLRSFMNFWTLLNVPARQAPNEPSRPPAWNRGAYLVEGLGHCGSCHTPMNVMMGPDFARSLDGAIIDGQEAPSLKADVLAAQGFDVASLTNFLATGISPQGTSFGQMHTVTHFSTSAMERSDVEAIATYLMTSADGTIPAPANPPDPQPESFQPAADGSDPGRVVFVEACAGCHGMTGEGIPNVAPPMRGNATITLANPLNLLSVIVNGVPDQTFAGNQRMYAMPPFAHSLSDEQIAELATWMRTQWGGHSEPVAVAEVNKLPRPVD
nr:cytochrome c [Acuticoccus kalidii]